MMMKYNFLTVLTILVLILNLSCDSGGESGDGQVPPEPELKDQFNLVNTFPELSFKNPLDIQNPGDGTNRLFIVEQAGGIYVVNMTDTGNSSQFQINGVDATSEVFLDLQNEVAFNGGELGLLGLAFHPNYENNGLFYVNYTAGNPLRTIISRFSVSAQNPNQADPESEVILIELDQHTTIHKGGQLVFGPEDGLLYISLGDGGAGGKSQDLTNLFGSILRIDVDNPEGEKNYGIPPDNPFFGNTSGFREEIYAYGLRNPWRISFDSVTGELWCGDVGQSSSEEINIIQSGSNYGWPIMEGELCFDPPEGCDPTGLEPPLLGYGRAQGGTVIGGIVYYGDELPSLFGLYIYADFFVGRVWALEFDGANFVNNTRLVQFIPFSIVALGTDEQGEIYIASFDDNIYRLERIVN